MNKLISLFKVNLRFLFLIAYLFIEFIRYGGAADFNQFLFYYLSILNTVIASYILLNLDEYKTKLKFLSKKTFFYLYGGFVLWGMLSYFYAINTSEVIIKSSLWISSFVVFVNCFILFKKSDFKTIASIFSILLILEVYSSFSAYWEIEKFMSYNFNQNSLLRGVTGNRNLTSLVFCLKIPFLLYFLNETSNKYLKLLSFIFMIWAIYTLILLGSRSSYIYFFVIIVISIIYNTFKNHKSLKEIFRNQNLLYSFLFAFILFSMFVGNQNSSSISSRISTIDFEETSTQQRLRFYSYGLNHIKNNIFIGVGLGNWKIKSIDYDSKNMTSYIVPYYLHNDFLEVGTELGIIGFLLYGGMFFYLIVYLIKNIFLNIFKNTSKSIPLYILFLCIIVYFIDSNLNFPHGRAISQVTINIFFALVILQSYSDEK